MFTIEHNFDASVITLVDEVDGDEPLMEDVIIRSYEDRIEVEQFDPATGEVMLVMLSMAQLNELRLALDLPEGSYRLSPRPAAKGD
ncbi:hypothetical protein ACEYYB_09850 [Paracoccus sp. p4-l81]